MRAFAADARAAGCTVIALDCRTVEPTEAGVLAALSAALGERVGSAAEAAEALRARGERVVLVLDGYEVLALADAWIRMTLLPALPAGARVAIASRETPLPSWRGELGPLLRSVALGNLAPADAETLLRRAGVPADQSLAVNAFAHGHPLALMLAASAIAERPDLSFERAAVPTVVDALARLYLDGLDPDTRRALDAASVTRRTTYSLLAALLPGEPAGEAFARLRALPFTQLSAEGLVVQDTVREAVATLLRAADPAGHRRLKVAAWHHLRGELRDAPPADLWRYTADMLYLIENPWVREIYFPTTSPTHGHEPARPGDWAGIEAIVAPPRDAGERRGDPPLLGRRARDVRRRARRGRRAVTGYYVLFVPRDVSPRVLDARSAREPHGASTCARIRCRTARSRCSSASGARCGGGRETPPGEPSHLPRHQAHLPGAAAGARPRLCPRARPRRAGRAARGARLHARARVRRAARRATRPTRCSPTSAPGRSTAGSPTSARASCTSRRARCSTSSSGGWCSTGGRSGSPASSSTCSTTSMRARAASSRARSCSATSGASSWTGDGNALEAVVSSLRRKLGARAKALQTVRGAGYRLAALS